MNAYPIVIFCGKAHSGKDTSASFLVSEHNAQTIALADPLKRMAFHMFGIPVAQLWGPSEERNKPIEHLASDPVRGACEALDTICQHAEHLVTTELGDLLDADQIDFAARELYHWGATICAKLRKEGALTARYILQTLGTEWGRDKIDPDLWAKLGVITAEKLLAGPYLYQPATGLREEAGCAAPLVAITDGRFRNEILAVRRLGGLALKVERPELDEGAEKAGVAGHRSESEMDRIPPHFFSTIIQNDSSLDNLKQRVVFAVERSCMPARLPMPCFANPALSGVSTIEPT